MMKKNCRMRNSIGIHFNITLIGAGNVAWHLAPALYDAGHHIVQIYSRTIESAQILAKKVGAQAINSYENIEPTAHIYIYAIKDDSLQWVMNHIKINTGIHIHTSGSMPISIFKSSKTNYGCMYPLQTFSKDKNIDLRKVAFFTEANTEENAIIINDLAHCMSQKIYSLSSEDRKYLHLAGVFASNFANIMWIKSEKILAQKGIPFEVLHNLITESVNKAKLIGPINSQTGPAIRGDQRIIDQHIGLLSNEPAWQEIYTLLSEQIKNEL